MTNDDRPDRRAPCPPFFHSPTGAQADNPRRHRGPSGAKPDEKIPFRPPWIGILLLGNGTKKILRRRDTVHLRKIHEHKARGFSQDKPAFKFRVACYSYVPPISRAKPVRFGANQTCFSLQQRGRSKSRRLSGGKEGSQKCCSTARMFP
jgi:hypothetical protein